MLPIFDPPDDPPTPKSNAPDPKSEACKTYLEQTKLLITLSSAFIIAPAVFLEKINFFDGGSIGFEICFILSVFTGYIVFGTISGTQAKGEFDVYNSNTRLFSWFQIGLFLLGIIILLLTFMCNLKKITTEKEPVTDSSVTRPVYHKGDTVRLNNIFFDFAKWNIRPESYCELCKVADSLKKYPKLRIEIGAHTDSVGEDSFNKSLSEKRAGSVVQYILLLGVSASQLESKGYGKTIPVMPNETDEGRQKNRRVEFKVLKI